MDIYSYILADHWISAIVNCDYSGLEDNEIKQLDIFLSDQPFGHWEIDSEEGFFAIDEVSGLYANCFECKLIIN
jgi:hypothetical protein